MEFLKKFFNLVLVFISPLVAIFCGLLALFTIDYVSSIVVCKRKKLNTDLILQKKINEFLICFLFLAVCRIIEFIIPDIPIVQFCAGFYAFKTLIQISKNFTAINSKFNITGFIEKINPYKEETRTDENNQL